MQDYLNSFLGVKSLSTLVMAFFGSAMSLRYIPELTKLSLITSLCGGTLVAVNAATLLVYWLALPEALAHAIAFFAGLLSMRAIPVLFALVDRFRGVKLPGLPDSKE